MSVQKAVQEENIALINTFFSLLAKRDILSLTEIASPEIIWHQPGENRFSGSHNGIMEVGMMMASMLTITQDNLDITPMANPMANNDLVSIPVRFEAKVEDKELTREGTDIFRVADGKIVEVWSFSSNQDEIDDFWAEIPNTTSIP
ncbi:nuclear transport factor 2 family protein [Veronia pacifica]|uniref:SnoaL-like domain-containing protein n=1 Tax=Veronia pacifica TaxID=1080227 RepID=A0A1C3EKX8_9GAMM|nr:nuclear transport factor 2 family protein [Veronia pacifica]ODA33893.1 hypothetical protein A8L45_08725 [Veronia pacifica]